jgi:WD40 repeat protein
MLIRGLIVVLLLAPAISAQQDCPLPPALQPVSHELNIFTDQQEADLGDSMAEGLAPELHVVSDDALTKYVREMGDRLVRYLPPNQFRFRFFLIDIPEANAFSISGGRIYVSRKTVALARNEDELAGVLAHELGHIVTHQAAIATTRDLRRILGITTVGDRSDIFSKYQQLLENYRRKPGRGINGEQEQSTADRVGLFAMSRAGYSAQAYVNILDRMQETHGKTGSWFSDIFLETPTEQRRLRETIRSMAALQPSCISPRPAGVASGFDAWRTDVIGYNGERSEQLPGLISRLHLAAPLRPDISNLRFSPNGKFLLAQDDGGIHVLTRDPFAVAFYIEAPDAFSAFFSPDSASVIVYNPALRIERWDIVSGKRASVQEVVVREPCLQTLLSPDGTTLACLNVQYALNVIDVASGTLLVSRKDFFIPNFFFIISLMLRSSLDSDARAANLQLISMAFSPEGRYLMAGGGPATLLFDVTNRRDADLPGSIRNLTRASFAFLGPDRIVGIDKMAANKSPVLRFPSGERIMQVPLGRGVFVGSPAHGDYLMVWPLKDFPLGIMDLQTKQVFVGFKHAVADIYDGLMVTERANGELYLKMVGAKEPIATLKLPQARLSGLRAMSVSSDLNWLAVSTRSRGALWDLGRNIRVQHTRGFTSAWIDDANQLYGDFPEFEDTPRMIVLLDQYGGTRQIYKIDKTEGVQYGPLILVTTRDKGSFLERKNWTLEARDYRKDQVVWSHRFPKEVPEFIYTSGGILLRWAASDGAARDEIQQSPEIKERAEKDDEFLELLDPLRGAIKGKLLFKTNKGSIRAKQISAGGGWIMVSTADNRTIVYPLAGSAEKGRFFGSRPLVAPTSGLLALENTDRELSTYDLATGASRGHYVFADNVLLKRFSPDGKRMFVFTSDQTAYVLDVAGTN